MKLITDERVKHRLTGVVVILSIAIIFVPAMIKKSNQHLGENINLSIKLPPRPELPKVAVLEEKAVFDAVKVARVSMPTMAQPPHASQVASVVPLAKTISTASAPKQPAMQLASEIAPVHFSPTQVVVINRPVVAAQTVVPVKQVDSLVKKIAEAKSGGYVVQLASFSQQRNAELLVSRLRSKGYKANYSKSSGKLGDMYRVVVGQLDRRDDALLLQKQLSENMQLSGFIIKTDVS